ncbi:MAG: hypothetical protein WAT41_02105 [Flavobacteriales bacterium]
MDRHLSYMDRQYRVSAYIRKANPRRPDPKMRRQGTNFLASLG